MRVSFTLSPLSLAAATWSRDLFSIHFPPPPPLPPPPSRHLLPPLPPQPTFYSSLLSLFIHFLSSDAPSTPPPTNPDPLSSSDSAFCRFLSSLHSSAFLLLASTHGRVAWWLEGDEYEEGGRVQGDEGEGV